MNFFNMGPGELIFILVLALLIFGPRRLPELARDLGKAISEFRRASEQLTSQMARELESAQDTLEEAGESVKTSLSEAQRSVQTSLVEAAAAAEGAAGTVRASPVEPTALAEAPTASRDAGQSAEGAAQPLAESNTLSEDSPPGQDSAADDNAYLI